MTLLDLLRRTRQLLSDDNRDSVVSWQQDDSGCEWSNRTLIDHLDAGRTEYCRRNPIRDVYDAGLCRVTAVGGGLGLLILDPRILNVRGMTHGADGWDVPFVTVTDIERANPSWLDRTGSGRPECWTWLDAGTVRVVPRPTADLDLHLRVDRLPLAPLTLDGLESEITDVPAEHQEVLKFWAGAETLETRAEEGNAKLAEVYRARFDLVAGPIMSASQLATRRRLAAGPVRVPNLGNRQRSAWV